MTVETSAISTVVTVLKRLTFASPDDSLMRQALRYRWLAARLQPTRAERRASPARCAYDPGAGGPRRVRPLKVFPKQGESAPGRRRVFWPKIGRGSPFWHGRIAAEIMGGDSGE